MIICFSAHIFEPAKSMGFVSSIRPISVMINAFLVLISIDYFYRLFSFYLLLTYLHYHIIVFSIKFLFTTVAFRELAYQIEVFHSEVVTIKGGHDTIFLMAISCCFTFV